MMYFLDFDRTLFDTDAFKRHLAKRSDTAPLAEGTEEELAQALEERASAGTLAFAEGELIPFVFPDVSEFLRSAGNEAVIITYGFPALQRLKVENALAGIPRVSALYTGSIRKGEFLVSRHAAYGADAVLADDTPLELEGVAKHCPTIRPYEMRRDGGQGDGRWPVIRSLFELPSV